VLGELTRQLLTVIPTHIEATGWQVFDKADVHGAVRATKELDAAVPPAAENLVRLHEAHGELPGDV